MASNLAIKSPYKNKREEVLDVASNCFLENGFDGTSINVMARDAGISKESIYRYFGSKEELFKAVVERELEVYRQGMESTEVEHDHSLEEALMHIAEGTLKVLTADRTQALRRLIFHMSANGSTIGKYYYETGPKFAYYNLKKVFDRHCKNAKFSSDKLARYFVSLVLHGIMLERQLGVVKRITKKDIHKRAKEAVDDFIEAFIRD